MTPTSTRQTETPLSHAILQLLTLQRASIWSLPGSARALALLWLGSAVAAGLVGLIYSVPLYYAGQQFGLSATMAFAAMAATAILRGRGDPMRLAYGFITIGVAATVARMAVIRIPIGQFDIIFWGDIALVVWSIAAAIRLAQSSAGWASRAARVTANLIIAATLVTAFEWDRIQSQAASLFLDADSDAAYQPIDAEALWTAQPQLLANAVRPLAVAPQKGSSTYLLAFAAAGSQQLFGREAAAVLAKLQTRYGGRGRAALFSNARKDLLTHPLANRTNLEGAIAAIKQSYDPGKVIVVIFLTSHGSRDAALSTNLPDYTRLAPLSAEFLAKTLDEANITRRVIIVSACYSGTWIKPLASPGTIILTASAADRTSFGCDDSLTYTVFGQAIVDSLSNPSVSLRDAFQDIKRRIARDEAARRATSSLPQVYVGTQMQRLWETPGVG